MSYVGTNGGNPHLSQALPNWKWAFASQVGLHTTEFPVGHRLLALWQFINSRTTHGSYHAGADSHGSSGQYCPWSWGAWHAPSINRWSGSVSANCRADEWDRMGATQRRNLINGMAREAHRYSRWQVANGRAAVPARKLTKAQAERREPGFVYHGALQADRSDPTGPRDVFPWSEFLAEYRRLESGGTTPVIEGEVMTEPRDVWRWRGTDHVNDNETTKDFQLSRAYQYANQANTRAGAILEQLPAPRDMWRGYRGTDHVNPDSPTTKDFQLSRAYQYAAQARSEIRELKAMVKALAKGQDDLQGGQSKLLEAVENAERDAVKVSAAEVAAELEAETKLNVKED